MAKIVVKDVSSFDWLLQSDVFLTSVTGCPTTVGLWLLGC
jgi:hypothetical protein